MSTWRYAKDNQALGPVETTALQALLGNGALPPETLVWKEGMANWAQARTLPEFAASLPVGAVAPPPLPATAGAPRAAAPPPLTSLAPVDSVAADIEKNKVFAVLAYIGILFLVPLLAAPQSKFARYHTNQGVVLFITMIIAYPCSFLVAFFTLGLSVFAVIITAVVFMILGIINAASGQCKPLPLIGHFQLIK